jgi:hypothetical protein
MAGYAVSVLAIAQCLNLERESRHAAWKLCILASSRARNGELPSI